MEYVAFNYIIIVINVSCSNSSTISFTTQKFPLDGIIGTVVPRFRYNVSYESRNGRSTIRQNTSHQFDYLPNPELTDIFPRRAFLG